MKKFDLLSIIFILIVSVSCDPTIEVRNVEQGNVNFENYIAIGNSLTAGYADGGLYLESQLTSFPQILSEQMKLAGGSEFKQPLMPKNGSGYLYLYDLVLGPMGLSPIISPEFPDPSAYDKVEGPFNNLGVPGIRAKDVTFEGYGLKNKYFGRMLPQAQESKSYFQVVSESNPTFFTCWMGNNDVLGYAATGGKDGVEGLPITGTNGITPLDQFTGSYAALMNALGDAKGVVMTIPNILLAPFFNTIPKAVIPITDQQLADQLNAAYAQYNQGVDYYNSQVPDDQKLRKIQFSIGPNYPVVVDKSIPDASQLPKISQLSADGCLLLTLPTANLQALKWGTAVPIPDSLSLTKSEVNNIQTYTELFNDVIRSYASSDIAVFESSDLLQKISQGMVVSGLSINSTFVNGGVFSLDGIHLTPRGNAILTNALIETINQKFGSTLPPVPVTTYRGVNFPK